MINDQAILQLIGRLEHERTVLLAERAKDKERIAELEARLAERAESERP